MRGRCCVLIAALLLTVSPSAVAQVTNPETHLGSEVRQQEEALVRGMQAREGTVLDRLLAPGFVLRAVPDIPRETWLRNALTLCWGDRFDIQHFEARQVGEAAVASFELTFYVDPATCQPALLRSLITDVWVRRQGQWQLEVRHAGAPAAASDVAGQYGAVPVGPPAWEVKSELSVVATAGNTSTATVGVVGETVHRAGSQESRASFDFLTNQVEGVTRARSLTLRARHAFRIRRRVRVFGDASFARDRFAGIAARTTAEAGLAYAAIEKAPHTLNVETRSGFTAERRLDGRNPGFATASGALHYAWKFGPGSEFTQDAAVTASLETARNWRATSATAVSVALTRLLTLKASHGTEYRNQPVPGFGRTDMRTALALVLSWQRRPATR